MRTGHSRVRCVVFWGLLVLALAVLAGPHGQLGAGSARVGGMTVATARTAVLPTVVHSTPHLIRADPASSAPLPLGTLPVSLLLAAGALWFQRVRGALGLRERLLAALQRGRSPPVEARSSAPSGM